MKYSIFSHIRDLIFLCLLFYLLKTAYDRNYTFLSAHKESIIHELDRSFIDQLYTAQRHVHFLQEYDDLHENNCTGVIADIKENLTIIEEKYHKNSPALVFLGPIGSAAIVAKEELLQQKLLAVVKNINQILYTTNKIEQFSSIQSIDEGLQLNKQLIHSLTNNA